MASPFIRQQQGSSIWVEQPGATLQVGETNEARYTRTFHASQDQGLVTATAQGFVKGAQMVYQGFLLTITTRAAKNIGGRDEVTIEYVGGAGVPPPPRAKKPHAPGDVEWTGGGALDESNPNDFIRADGLSDSGLKAYLDTLADDAKLLMPKYELTMKKWITPPYVVGSAAAPKVLPRTFDQVQALLALITWAKPGYVLGAGTEEKKWLCTDQTWDGDGELICVSSKFTQKADGWDTAVYPALGGGTYGAKQPAAKKAP